MLAINLRGRMPGSVQESVLSAPPRRRSAAPAPRKAKTERNPLVLPSLGLTTIIACTAAYFFREHTRAGKNLSRAIAKEQRDSTDLADLVQSAKYVQSQDSLFSARVKALLAIDERRFLWPHVLESLHTAVPAGVWLTTVEEKKGGKEPIIHVSGRAISSKDITMFLDELQQRPWFTRSRLIASDQQATRHGAITEFTIELQFTEATGPDNHRYIALRPDRKISAAVIRSRLGITPRGMAQLKMMRPTPRAAGVPRP